LSKDKYFNNREYLLGDLAFSASSVLVPTFKKGQNFNPPKSRDTSTQSLKKFEN